MPQTARRHTVVCRVGQPWNLLFYNQQPDLENKVGVKTASVQEQSSVTYAIQSFSGANSPHLLANNLKSKHFSTRLLLKLGEKQEKRMTERK